MAAPRPRLSCISSNPVNDNGSIISCAAGAKAAPVAALCWWAPVAALFAAPVVGVTPTPLAELDATTSGALPLLSDGATFGFLASFSAFSVSPGGRGALPVPWTMAAAYAGRPCQLEP